MLACGKVNPKSLVDFVHSFIYEITDQGAPYKYLYGENFIEGKYQKYNNNAGWAGALATKDFDQAQIAQALSHFSWQLTEGYLMMVDL